MVMVLAGNGSITGVSSMPTNVQFGGTVGVTGAMNASSLISASSGIVFPTNPGGATVATLNDYEVGTWTPVITGSSGNPTSYTSSGYYVKIGRIACLTFQFTITNGSGGSGTAVISGFPFTTITTSWGAGNRNALLIGREDALTGYTYHAFIVSNSTSGQVYLYNGSLSSWTNNSMYFFCGCYETAV